MTIFEDPLEIHHNALGTVQGPRELDTLVEALQKVSFPPEDVAIIMDWDSIYEIADKTDVFIPWDDKTVPKEHVELSTERIGRALDTRATIHGIESGQSFGLVVNPGSVRLSNDIAHQPGVVAIDWVEIND